MPSISSLILAKFPYEPTEGQKRLFSVFDHLIGVGGSRSCNTVLIKGYAGTGKTTVVSTLIEQLKLFNYKYLLMAPTGRAAKVLGSYTGRPAFTMHKTMYKQVADPSSGELKFLLQRNYYKKTVFIVDEASMLSDDAEFGARGLLHDLVRYVFEDSSNKLVLIGDTAQLPPVGKSESPGLNVEYLRTEYGLDLADAELRDVVRQEASSGILENATYLREQLGRKEIDIKMHTRGFKDIYRIGGEKLEDGLRYAYDKYGMEKTSVICRANWQAVRYNQMIRRHLLYFEEELEAGDMLMVVRNNYFFLPADSPAGFLANGDFVRVKKLFDVEERFGFRFAQVELQMADYPDLAPFEAKIVLDTLHSNTPSLSAEEGRKLYGGAMEQYADISSKKKKKEAMQTDEYLNALQVKFAYALTCHKSQGGQWPVVFIDHGARAEQEYDKEYVRWLYTALTRAEKELYLLNFPPDLFTG